MRRIWEQDTGLGESRSKSLMLALDRDTVEFEANMVLLIRFPVAE